MNATLTRATPTTTAYSTPTLTVTVFAVNIALLFAFLLSPLAPEYPLAALSIVTFLFAQAVFPACRLCNRAPLCPANIAQGFFWMQLVLVSVLAGYWGFQPGTLPYVPVRDAINTGIVLRIIGYLAFCAIYQWVESRRQPSEPEPRDKDARRESVAARMIVPFALLGLVGFFLTFGGIQEFVEYLTTPSSHNLQLEATLATAAGTFLRYFLGFAVVLAWSLWIGRQDKSQGLTRRVLVTGATFVMLVFANISYNRGSMLGPALALAAAFSVHVARFPFKGVILSAVLALAAALAIGWYRSSDVEESARNDHGPAEHLVEFIQIYASAPQMAGFMIENLERDGRYYYGSTLLPSLLYPIPSIGRPFRESSGVYIFNAYIYGDTDVLDQNFPLDAEFYINFHILGVALGYALLGWILNWYQFRFLSAPNAIESYSWMTLALWTVFPGSLSVASQMYVYAFWPIYVYFGVQALARARWVARPAWQRTMATLSSGKAGKA